MIKVGFGYDSHRFEAGRPLILGGLKIDHAQGLAGHSDADAVLHALIDAILGAAGLGDIGEHFPDTDPKWRGADSAKLLQHVTALLAGEKFRLVNCDITIITESPKLSPHKQPMRARIAQLLGLPESAVNVKAKTNEHMGWVGRGEGLAAIAAVLIEQM